LYPETGGSLLVAKIEITQKVKKTSQKVKCILKMDEASSGFVCPDSEESTFRIYPTLKKKTVCKGLRVR
jgi:exoribonuclease II